MNATWTVRIERLETQLPVGIYAHEQDAQPVWVSLTATGEASAAPGSLDECFDYEPLCRWLTQVWPATPHTPLLETRVNQVMAFVFAADPRVHKVWVGLYKQRVSQQALAVGMERAASRTEFEALRLSAVDTAAMLQTLTQEGESHASLAQ
ncbi:dihydroneopterin aldolase [Hydrogenophaga sp. OTU3427]|uniref:dihydroneopterin aldolase n=1 Tax=Hydrogenophaga sp. OTU3427 TaxID=3043856 RepID=UPI00313B62FF